MSPSTTPLSLRKIPADLPPVVETDNAFLPAPYNALTPDVMVDQELAPQPEASLQQKPRHAPPTQHAPAQQRLLPPAQMAPPLELMKRPATINRMSRTKLHVRMLVVFLLLSVGIPGLGFFIFLIAPGTDAGVLIAAISWLLAGLFVPAWIITAIIKR